MDLRLLYDDGNALPAGSKLEKIATTLCMVTSVVPKTSTIPSSSSAATPNGIEVPA
jgi:hypothetical protein